MEEIKIEMSASVREFIYDTIIKNLENSWEHEMPFDIVYEGKKKVLAPKPQAQFEKPGYTVDIVVCRDLIYSQEMNMVSEPTVRAVIYTKVPVGEANYLTLLREDARCHSHFQYLGRDDKPYLAYECELTIDNKTNLKFLQNIYKTMQKVLQKEKERKDNEQYR